MAKGSIPTTKERVSEAIKAWADPISKVLISLSVLVTATLWVLDRDQRRRVEVRSLWEIITANEEKIGNGGRNAALERLAELEQSLAGVGLQNACLVGLKLEGENVNLQGANLRGTRLDNATLRGINLKDAAMQGAAVPHADFTGAILEGVEIENCDVFTNQPGKWLSKENYTKLDEAKWIACKEPCTSVSCGHGGFHEHIKLREKQCSKGIPPCPRSVLTSTAP